MPIMGHGIFKLVFEEEKRIISWFVRILITIVLEIETRNLIEGKKMCKDEMSQGKIHSSSLSLSFWSAELHED